MVKTRKTERFYMEKEIKVKQCELYDRECIGCLECEVCDLDENKICDNCGKCIEVQDVASIKIDKIYLNPEEYKE